MKKSLEKRDETIDNLLVYYYVNNLYMIKGEHNDKIMIMGIQDCDKRVAYGEYEIEFLLKKISKEHGKDFQ